MEDPSRSEVLSLGLVTIQLFSWTYVEDSCSRTRMWPYIRGSVSTGQSFSRKEDTVRFGFAQPSCRLMHVIYEGSMQSIQMNRNIYVGAIKR